MGVDFAAGFRRRTAAQAANRIRPDFVGHYLPWEKPCCKRDWDGALAVYQDAERRSKFHWPAVSLGIAEAHVGKRNYADALAYFDKAVVVDSGDPGLSWIHQRIAWLLATGPDGLRVRGEISKARGDRAAALLDFEQLAREVDDPALRLELAKLYEHHVKAPDKALEQVLAGTGEDEVALVRRRSRLEKKAQRSG